jgi:hypothetical protein
MMFGALLGAVSTASAQSASVTVVKDAQPDSPQDFDFDATGTGIATDIDLDDDADPTLSNSETFPINADQFGTKTITESTVAGWTLSSIDCTGVSEFRQGNTVTFTVSAGDQIVCTFINTPNASVTVVKDAQPDSPQDFDFDATGTGIATDIDLDDDADPTLSNS